MSVSAGGDAAGRIRAAVPGGAMFKVIDHPLAADLLTVLRDRHTEPPEFRETAERLGYLLVAEALADMSTDEVAIETPLEHTQGHARQLSELSGAGHGVGPSGVAGLCLYRRPVGDRELEPVDRHGIPGGGHDGVDDGAGVTDLPHARPNRVLGPVAEVPPALVGPFVLGGERVVHRSDVGAVHTRRSQGPDELLCGLGSGG